MARPIPPCPSCGGAMQVTALVCPSCGTGVTGRFAPQWRELTPEQAEFARLFLALRGNLREMQRTLGLSYGALRSRLDAVVQSLGGHAPSPAPETPAPEAGPGEVDAVLRELEAGSIDAAEALRRLGRPPAGSGPDRAS